MYYCLGYVANSYQASQVTLAQLATAHQAESLAKLPTNVANVYNVYNTIISNWFPRYSLNNLRL